METNSITTYTLQFNTFNEILSTMFGLVLIILFAVNVIGQQIQFNCSQKLLFTPLDVKLCCKVPAIRFNKYRDECYSQTFANGISKKIDDNFTFINPCAVECVLKQAGALIENNHLNMSSMKKLIQSNVPNNPELVDTIHLGYEKCAKEILSKIKEFEANRESIGKSKNKAYQGLKTPCSPFSVLVSYCALRHAFINCPQNSWINTDVCNNARNYVKNCEPAQFGGRRNRERKNGKSKTTTSTTMRNGGLGV